MERKFWLSTLATCNDAHLTSLWEKFGFELNFTWLRKPEIGSIMCQGKIGVTGNNFNFGEVTITRCQLKTSQGKIGHGYVQGRNKHKAEIVAICDALLQTNKRDFLIKNIIRPLVVSDKNLKKDVMSKSESTAVDFFTLVRGET